MEEFTRKFEMGMAKDEKSFSVAVEQFMEVATACRLLKTRCDADQSIEQCP